MLAPLRFYQSAVSLKELGDRVRTYRDAREAAAVAGKPLLNVGCPSTNPMGFHSCGDVCLDVDPSRLIACTAPEPRVGDVRAIPYANGHFGAATCFHVLEHLPTVADAEQALSELHRVADRVFVLSPSRLNPMAWLHPEHHLWPIHEADGSIRFEQRDRGSENGEIGYPLVQQCWAAWDALVRSVKIGLASPAGRARP